VNGANGEKCQVLSIALREEKRSAVKFYRTYSLKRVLCFEVGVPDPFFSSSRRRRSRREGPVIGGLNNHVQWKFLPRNGDVST
jgi:hypothetical protein